MCNLLRLIVSLLVFSCACFSTETAYAHDFWIEVSNHAPEVGERVKIKLKVGEHFLGHSVPRNDDKKIRFDLYEGGKLRPVRGPSLMDLAGIARFQTPGTAVILFQNTHSRVVLKAKKFNSYLREEGLEHIIDLREQRKERDQDGREKYARYVKSFLRVAQSDTSEVYKKRFGLPFELSFSSSPHQTPDKTLVRVTFREKVKENIQIVALHHKNPKEAQIARSDANGQVLFNLSKKGLWLIKAVHMSRLENDPEADWESYWASISFEQDKS